MELNKVKTGLYDFTTHKGVGIVYKIDLDILNKLKNNICSNDFK